MTDHGMFQGGEICDQTRLRAALILVITSLVLAGCSTPQQKKAKFIAAGKQLLVKKDYQRAILQFKNALQLDPKDAEAHYQLAEGYLALGGMQQAAGELYKATELDPKHAKAQLTLAELMAGTTNKDLIADAYKRASAVAGAAPNDPNALTTLALTELRLGQTEEAERDTLKALEKAPDNLRSSMLLVAMKLAQKDLPGAERVIKEAVATAPNSADPLLALGRFYRASQRLPEAEVQFQRAIQIAPKNGAALVELAAVQMLTGNKQAADETYRKAAALPDRQYKAVHALFLMGDNRTDAAIAEMKELYRKDQSDRDLRNMLMRAYMSTNKTKDATDLLSAVLAKNPKDVDALVQRAGIRITAGQYDDAQKDLLPVLNLKPDLGEAHYLLARVHQAHGEAGTYRQELEEAVRRDPRHLRARLELVSLLVASNAAQAALELMDQIPADQRRNITVMVQHTGALMANGRWAEAEKEIDAGLKISRDPALLIQDALAKLQRKDTPGARKSLEEALSREPESKRALDILVTTYRNQGQLNAAIAKVQEYATQRPKSSMLLQYLGGLYVANRQLDRARAAFEAAKSANPANLTVDLNLAQLDLEENRLEEARKTLSSVLKRDPGNQTGHMLMGLVDERSGNTPGAIENYRQVLDKNEKNVGALNNLAYLLTTEAKLDEAMGYAQKARELAPADTTIEDTLGWVYYSKGMYPAAVEHLESVVSKAPSARRKYHLAMAYLKAGDRQRGAVTLEQALKMDTKLPEAQMAQQVLSETAGGSSRQKVR
jgi:tetratricopeptide (TPR) repeat protein